MTVVNCWQKKRACLSFSPLIMFILLYSIYYLVAESLPQDAKPAVPAVKTHDSGRESSMGWLGAGDIQTEKGNCIGCSGCKQACSAVLIISLKRAHAQVWPRSVFTTLCTICVFMNPHSEVHLSTMSVFFFFFYTNPYDLHECLRANFCLSHIPLHPPLHPFISGSIPLRSSLLIVPGLCLNAALSSLFLSVRSVRRQSHSTQLLKI